MVHRHACWQNLIHIRYNIHIFLMINQINCGIQIETTEKLHVTPVRRGAINQIKSSKDWGACSEKGTLPHTHLYQGCLQLTVMGAEPSCLFPSTQQMLIGFNHMPRSSGVLSVWRGERWKWQSSWLENRVLCPDVVWTPRQSTAAALPSAFVIVVLSTAISATMS